MKKRLILSIACAFALVAAFALVGCGSSSSSSSSSSAESSASTAELQTIKVGAVPTPHAEILNDVVAPLLEKEGYKLEVTEFDDYVLPNTALDSGDIDANYFQHVPYMEDFNAENGTDIVEVVSVHFEPFGIYAGQAKSLDELKEWIADGRDVTIAVPNDTTNEARALLLLEAQGIIQLPEDAGIDVTAIDIIDKPANLTIEEIEAAQTARVLEDVAVACINGNYAQQADLTADDALAIEDVESISAQTYANVLSVNNGHENDEAIQALAKALTSDDVKTYISEKYGNSVIAVF